jgi:hypothetical protein
MPRIFLVWLVLASCIGWAVYQLKYEVQRLETRLAVVNRQILADQEAIQVLKAEWSYLNQPAHLAELAQRFLGLEPVGIKQMVTVAAVPARRGGGAPAVVASAPPAAAPAVKLPPPVDLDQEATSLPADLPEEPATTTDSTLLLVKGVPQ